MRENILNFVKREDECEQRFVQEGQFWHLYTPGMVQEMIFKSDDDFRYGITSSAMSLQEINSSGKRLKLFAFALMSNHIHNLLCGTGEDCIEYFNLWKARLKRYFLSKVDLSDFKCSLNPVESLKSFRNEVAYINRNGYVNNLREIPFSYKWSSGRYYFNPVTAELPTTAIKDLNCRDKRMITKSRVTNLYDSLCIWDGCISPLSFCEIDLGEKMYNTPHQYFKLLHKSVEEYSLIAQRIGDSIFLNDDEMYSVVCQISKESYNVSLPKLLAPDNKIKMAKIMHHKYKASNSQIQRILKIDRNSLDSLFPKVR